MRRSGDDRRRRRRRSRQRVGPIDRYRHARPLRRWERARCTGTVGRHDAALDAHRRLRLRCRPDGGDAVLVSVHRRRRRRRLPPVSGRVGGRHLHHDQLRLLRPHLCHHLHARRGRGRCRRERLRHCNRECRDRSVSAAASAGHDTAFNAYRALGLRSQPVGDHAVLVRIHRQCRSHRLPVVPRRRAGRHGHGHQLHLHGPFLRDDVFARGGSARCRGQCLRHLLDERRDAGVCGRLDTAFDTRGSRHECRRPDLGDAFVVRVDRRHRGHRVPSVPGRLAGRDLGDDELHLHGADLRDDLHPRRRRGRCRRQRLGHRHEERHHGRLPGHHPTLDADRPRPEHGGPDVRAPFVERVDRQRRSHGLSRVP